MLTGEASKFDPCKMKNPRVVLSDSSFGEFSSTCVPTEYSTITVPEYPSLVLQARVPVQAGQLARRD